MVEIRRPILKRAWTMLQARPFAYITVTLLPYIVVLGLSILIGRLIVSSQPVHNESWEPISLWRSMSWGERLLIILAFYGSAAVPAYLATRGICRMALAQQKNSNPSLGNLLTDMLGFLPVAILYFLILGIPTFVASGFLVIPGLLVAAAFGLIIPAGIDRKLGPLAAIRCGLSLVGRVYSRVLGVYGVYFVFLIALRMVLPLVIGKEDAPISSPSALLAPLGILLLFTLTPTALVNIAITLLYSEATLDPRPTSHSPEEHAAQRSTAAE